MIILKQNILAGLLLFSCVKVESTSTDMATEIKAVRKDLNKVIEEMNVFQQTLDHRPNFSECLDIVKDVIKRPTVVIVAGLVATSYLIRSVSQTK
ncbi:MAG TPA: hypothetical protein VL201_01190 [Patescibacteria group bacterium]|jgi:uncharacterized UPF0160 family protein|nr:hypothetical protein [Patescibacteria group bacterium]